MGSHRHPSSFPSVAVLLRVAVFQVDLTDTTTSWLHQRLFSFMDKALARLLLLCPAPVRAGDGGEARSALCALSYLKWGTSLPPAPVGTGQNSARSVFGGQESVWVLSSSNRVVFVFITRSNSPGLCVPTCCLQCFNAAFSTCHA